MKRFTAMVAELPRWSQERPSRLSSIRSTFSYFAIRVLAVVGILLVAERAYTSWADNYMAASRVPVSALHEAIKPHVAADASAAHKAIPDKPKPKPKPKPPPPPPPKTKAIIAASMRGDNVSWINDFFPDWVPSIFVMDDTMADLTVTRSGGHEASAYLTYIVNHYYNLPDYMVFLHARRYQWHNDDVMYDHVPILQSLKLPYVDEVGYQSLRSLWEPGCPVEVHPKPGGEDGYYEWDAAYAEAWEIMWPGIPVPTEIGAPCCAQFAVSRAQVMARSVRDYERIRQWVWTTEVQPQKSGRIMEYMWHIIFGQNVISCPPAKETYCKAFGACDLECPSEGWCDNRYWRPAWDQSLPEQWPALEFQGNNGWPVDNWWKAPKPAPEPAPEPKPEPKPETAPPPPPPPPATEETAAEGEKKKPADKKPPPPPASLDAEKAPPPSAPAADAPPPPPPVPDSPPPPPPPPAEKLPPPPAPAAEKPPPPPPAPAPAPAAAAPPPPPPAPAPEAAAAPPPPPPAPAAEAPAAR